jgi:hypothetical protein
VTVPASLLAHPAGHNIPHDPADPAPASCLRSEGAALYSKAYHGRARALCRADIRMVYPIGNLRSVEVNLRSRSSTPWCRYPHCHVPARRVFTKTDDGLAQPWYGLLWLNMPFGGRNGHVPWLQKFFAHAEGVAVVRAYTSSGWWHQNMHRAQMILFPRGKTRFVRPDGSVGLQPGHGVALIGMGEVACAALQASGLGMIWDRRSELPARSEPARQLPTLETQYRSLQEQAD